MACELEASSCPQCGLLAVPPEPIACERCGEPVASLHTTTIGAAGTVVGHAVVHQHGRPDPPTPFVVVEVRLDDGPIVKSLLRGAVPGTTSIGDRVDGDYGDGRFAFVAAASSSGVSA